MQGSSRRNHSILYLCVTKTTGGIHPSVRCAPFLFVFVIFQNNSAPNAYISSPLVSKLLQYPYFFTTCV
jgi:hypothetical protein